MVILSSQSCTPLGSFPIQCPSSMAKGHSLHANKLNGIHNMRVTFSQADTLPLRVDIGDGDPTEDLPIFPVNQAWNSVTIGSRTSKW